MRDEQVIEGETGTTASRTIVVNGREVVWPGEDIDGRQLARLAFPNADADRRGRALTVTFSGGPESGGSGILAPGRKTMLADRQSFNVGLTDKS